MPGVELFRNDRRGAIVVIALFMAVVLVGVLQYMMGVGQTIVMRESMQDGADGIAYAAAVYDARGMNVIAMVNLIMAAVLGVLVFLKIVQLILTVAKAVTCFLAFVPGVGEICPLAEAAEPIVEGWADAVAKAEVPILEGMHSLEVGAAELMPWVAEARSLAASWDYPLMDVGFTASLSMFPMARIDQTIINAVSTSRSSSSGSSGSGSSSPSSGSSSEEPPPTTTKGRLGLPVQVDNFARLCRAAGKVLAEGPADTINSVINVPGLSKVMQWVGDIVGWIVSSVPSYFCGSDTQVPVQQVAQAACSKGNSAAKSAKGKKAKPIANCQSNVSGQVQSAATTTETADTNKRTPMKVYQAATFGTDYYAVWGFAETSAMAGSPWFYSEAEIYYDKGFGDFTFGFGNVQTWSEDAMWNMRWRARLRRFRTPTPAVAGILGNLAYRFTGDKLKSALKLIKVGGIGKKIADSSEWAWIFQEIWSKETKSRIKDIDDPIAKEFGLTLGMEH